MKESEFIGTLMPSPPDLQPIIQKIREKYQFAEISPMMKQFKRFT